MVTEWQWLCIEDPMLYTAMPTQEYTQWSGYILQIQRQYEQRFQRVVFYEGFFQLALQRSQKQCQNNIVRKTVSAAIIQSYARWLIFSKKLRTTIAIAIKFRSASKDISVGINI